MENSFQEVLNMSKIIHNIKKDIQWEIYGLLLISIGVIGIFAIYTNAVGVIGVFLNKNLRGFTGQMAIALPLFIISLGIYCIYYKKKPEFSFRILGTLILFVVLVLLFHINTHLKIDDNIFLDRLKASAKLGVKGAGGGILGETLISILFNIFGTMGSYILIFTLAIIGIILSTGFSISSILKKIKSNHDNKPNIVVTPKTDDKKENKHIIENNEAENKADIADIRVINNTKPAVNQGKKDNNKQNENSEPIIINTSNVSDVDYKLPPFSLLKKSPCNENNFSEKELLNSAKVLENTLESFGLEAKVVQVSCGPTITRFEIQPSPGVKVSKIMNLTNDIALSLAVTDVRIEAPIPGKAAVGIEVPNKTNSTVFLRDVIDTPDFTKSTSKVTIGLGKDIGGNPVLTDLSKMPHLLIAGATGAGKSVCINTIICSILYKANPNEVKFMLIDPKVVELTVYNGIPHLLTPVVTDAKKAAAALNWMVSEMEKRYKLFAEQGVRDITRYNEVNKDEPLPKIVIIVDELADLMMVSPREVEDCICRLAQMARAAGIHLVVATQRPSVDIITGLIKANIPSRISFAVSSQVDSRTILDMGGAEKLLGKGDMLFFPVGASKPMRIQGAYISDNEVEKLVEFVNKQQQPKYEKNLLELKEVEYNSKQDDIEDELFEEALATIMDCGQASISMLQRKLRIGYARAARLIDQMEEKGFIGGYEGTKPREILITREQFEQYFNKEKTGSGV